MKLKTAFFELNGIVVWYFDVFCGLYFDALNAVIESGILSLTLTIAFSLPVLLCVSLSLQTDL